MCVLLKTNVAPITWCIFSALSGIRRYLRGVCVSGSQGAGSLRARFEKIGLQNKEEADKAAAEERARRKARERSEQEEDIRREEVGHLRSPLVVLPKPLNNAVFLSCTVICCR